MDVLIGNMFLLIEMAHKTKRTLTRAELKKKIKEENVKRAKGLEEVKRKVEEVQKEARKKGWGMKALKEIKKFQSWTELLIQKLLFQRLVKGLIQAKQNQSKGAGPSCEGTARSRGDIPGGVIGAGKPVCGTHKVHDGHAKRYPTGQENQGDI